MLPHSILSFLRFLCLTLGIYCTCHHVSVSQGISVTFKDIIPKNNRRSKKAGMEVLKRRCTFGRTKITHSFTDYNDTARQNNMRENGLIKERYLSLRYTEEEELAFHNLSRINGWNRHKEYSLSVQPIYRHGEANSWNSLL